jgi:predicted RNase H-like nuclease
MNEGRMSVSLRGVLGIDAAWTSTQPSGVAAAVQGEDGWRLAAVEASYGEFIARAEGADPLSERPMGAAPDAVALLDAASKICGRPIDLVGVDMPMARHPIVGRRPSDRCVSEAYGAKHAATHSPSALRPGKISDALRLGFEEAGYPLRAKDGAAEPPKSGLIEVYPHPALIEFLGANRRLEYKAAKARKYWPDVPSNPKLSANDRRVKLREVWSGIVEALDAIMRGVAVALPLPADEDRGWRLKAYEDKLDAVVCAAVAIACLTGKAKAFGDADSAIWVPIAEA